MRFFVVLVLSLQHCFAGFSYAQSLPTDGDVALRASLAGNQIEFRLGETIPLQLAFSSSAKDHYQINMAQYDRSGRMDYEQFTLSPAGGAVDPLVGHLGGTGGGLTGFQFLSAQPWTITLNLNEWLRFTQPGEYRLTVRSKRVGIKDSSSAFNFAPVDLRSNEVLIRIVPATEAWQKQVLAAAVEALNQPRPPKPEVLESYIKSQRRALETLRFLGTADATRELAKRMRGEDLGGLDYVCMFGLLSSPERSVAQSALEQELAEPDHPITQNFLYTLRALNSDSDGSIQHWRDEQREIVEALIDVLPDKRGQALAVSLGTAMNEAWNADLPKHTTDKLLQQMIAMFDQLPLDVQNNLLTYRWDKIAEPQMLPILRRYAQAYRDFPQMREANAYNSLQLSASALQHWYELDPEGARPAIIQEIIRPRPRYSARVLGILPDETLPEVDSALAQNLRANDDFDGLANISSLIARYSTDAILPQVLEKLDPHIGKWACAIQDPLLAYVLRVNSGMAQSRISQAVAARGPAFSACNHGLFHSIAEIHFDPVLEQIAIESLDDPDVEVAMNAASALGHYGSLNAQPALLKRFTAWASSWSRRESELDLTFADSGDRTKQFGLGENLMLSLTTARSWLADEAVLRRLMQLTTVKRIHDQLESYLTLWGNQPLVIGFNHNPPPGGFNAHVAQYGLTSLKALEDKLGQFPAGTKFILGVPREESTENAHSLAELRVFLSNHRLIVAGEKQTN